MQGGSSGLYFFLFYSGMTSQQTQKKKKKEKLLYIVCIQNFHQIYAFNPVLSSPSLPAPPDSLFPHKELAPTTLLPSMVTTSVGRDAKIHHHIR